MTHNKGELRQIAELSAAFMALSDRDKDIALAVLRTLSFAQEVMGAETYEAAGGQPQSVRAG